MKLPGSWSVVNGKCRSSSFHRHLPQHSLGTRPRSRSSRLGILWGVFIDPARIATPNHVTTRNIFRSGSWVSSLPSSVNLTGIIGESSVFEVPRWSLKASTGGGGDGIQYPLVRTSTWIPTGPKLAACLRSTASGACWSRQRNSKTNGTKSDRPFEIFCAMAAFAKSCDHADLEIIVRADRYARRRTG